MVDAPRLLYPSTPRLLDSLFTFSSNILSDTQTHTHTYTRNHHRHSPDYGNWQENLLTGKSIQTERDGKKEPPVVSPSHPPRKPFERAKKKQEGVGKNLRKSNAKEMAGEAPWQVLAVGNTRMDYLPEVVSFRSVVGSDLIEYNRNWIYSVAQKHPQIDGWITIFWAAKDFPFRWSGWESERGKHTHI